MSAPEAIEGQFIDERPAALAVRDPTPAPAAVSLFAGDPADVITQAVKVADALKAIVQSKGLVKKIQGREFIEVAGWQTLGAMTRVTAFCEWSRPVEGGWEARVVVRNAGGVDIGAAEAQCTRKEKSWSGREDFALRSMAQTRATSKALRSVLGFIVVLAGYKDTPAEEMDDSTPLRAPAPAPNPAPAAHPYAFGCGCVKCRGIKAVHDLCDKRGVKAEQRHSLSEQLFGKTSSNDLTLEQLRALYKELDLITRQEEQQ